jgi:hypothetical protein
MATKSTKNRLIIIISIEILLLLIFGIGDFYLFHSWTLHQEDIPKPSILPTRPDDHILVNKPDVQETTTPTIELPSIKPTSTQYITPTRAPITVCGGPPKMMILGLGIDIRYDDYIYGLADVIRVAQVDFVSGKVTVLTLPRDLLVEIPDMEDRGITNAKLNQAYFYGTEYYGFYEGPDLGPGMMMDTLEHNFGLRIDRYITINMATFKKIIDAVG